MAYHNIPSINRLMDRKAKKFVEQELLEKKLNGGEKKDPKKSDFYRYVTESGVRNSPFERYDALQDLYRDMFPDPFGDDKDDKNSLFDFLIMF